MLAKLCKLCIILLLFILNYSCSQKQYLAPNEIDKIVESETVTIITQDDAEVLLKSVYVEDEKIIGYTEYPAKEEIPFSSIKAVIVRDIEFSYEYMYIGVLAVAGGLIYQMTAAPSPPPPPPSECCPLIYSFDGRYYVFDAEPYGGAICEGLKRTEYCGLQYLREVNENYRIRIINKLDEVQFIDEVNLVVVDYPKGVMVAPDVSGVVHTFIQPIAPLSACDRKGKDICYLISDNDDQFWGTDFDYINRNNGEILKDTLLLKFPKPDKVKQVKLLVNLCTSMWGSHMGKEFLSLYGNTISKYYDEVGRYGPAFYKTVSWYLDEELYLLKIRTHTEEGWLSKGVIMGGGPLITEDKAYVLDISDVRSDTLTIMLTPAINFWKINYIAVDYSDDLPIKVASSQTAFATDQNGKDIRRLLESDDGEYYIMTEKEYYADLVFRRVPQTENTERSFILKTCGYYEIQLNEDAEPQTAVLEKIYNEPGFSAKYALKEYLHWQEAKVKAE